MDTIFFVDDEGTAWSEVFRKDFEGRKFFAADSGDKREKERVAFGNPFKVVDIIWIGCQIVHQSHGFFWALVSENRHFAVLELGLDAISHKLEFDRFGE